MKATKKWSQKVEDKEKLGQWFVCFSSNVLTFYLTCICCTDCRKSAARCHVGVSVHGNGVAIGYVVNISVQHG